MLMKEGNLMFRITSKEEVFYNLFEDTAVSICNSAEMLKELMENYVDVKKKIHAIEETEHECDIHVHTILEQLNKSFITPIDREDIYAIAKELDNITDAIEATAHRFDMLNVQAVRPDAIKLANLIVECTNELKEVMSDLKNMKRSKTLRDKIIEVNRIEDDGDNIFRSAVTDLFITEKDAVEVIKWKEIYEYLESTLDACEDVANLVEGVVMKNA
jgi:uncharacterized protein